MTALVKKTFDEAHRGVLVQIVDEFDISTERLGDFLVKRFERKASSLFTENRVESLDGLSKLNNVRLLLLRPLQQRVDLVRLVGPVIDKWATEVCWILQSRDVQLRRCNERLHDFQVQIGDIHRRSGRRDEVGPCVPLVE